MDWNDESLTIPDDKGWWHATISFPGDAGITPEAAAILTESLADQRFHFLRKAGKLRLRTWHSAAAVLDRLVVRQLVTSWTYGIYEPETMAFGGPAGMMIAHELFCADSPAALAETGNPYGRERCILLISAMNRAAGLDPFEIGDVWAKIANLRPAIGPPPEARRQTAASAMRRLLNADAAQRHEPEAGWPERVAAFHEAGAQLARLSSGGQLTRGLRSVLAHQAIFALNRSAVSADDQAAAALLAQHVIFGDTHDHNPLENTMTALTEPAQLRRRMVDRLTESGHLRAPAVIGAFEAVERHRFIPHADVLAAYAEDAVAIKHGRDSEMISCISAPSIVATQLEQLSARPGHKILEAGAATGYNAALLSRIVGPGGHVWTLDVDRDLVDGARTKLAEAGASNVTVVFADGAAGLPDRAPFDRIQFTVGAGDIPVTVLDQLAPGGRLVIPMRIRGSISRSFAFERDGGTWKTVSCEMATFVPMRKGSFDDIRTIIPMAGEGNVRIETFSEQNVDREALSAVLQDRPYHKVYTGVKFRQGSPWEWLYLWLACTLPNGLSRMPGQRPGFKPHFSWGSMAALDGNDLAYLTVREDQDAEGPYWGIGVIGHGPRSDILAEEVAASIEEWARDYGNDAPVPGFRMATDPNRDLLKTVDPRFIIDKPASRLVVDWP